MLNQFKANGLYITKLLLLLVITSCSDHKQDIQSIMETRDLAVSNQDINSYSKLLLDAYHHQGQSKSDIINNLNSMFEQFNKTEMSSSNRVIHFIDDSHAECEQSYTLRVKMDGDWRQTVQRERLSLTLTNQGWKISGGL